MCTRKSSSTRILLRIGCLDVWCDTVGTLHSRYGTTLGRLFGYASEKRQIRSHRLSSSESIQILQSIEERNERLPCPDRCPASIYNLLLSCWALNSKDRPHFHQISAHLTSSRPKQSRVHRDHKELHHLTLLRGDTISVFDSSPEKALWKGQNHRTQQVGLFPRLCLSTSTSNEKISWPVQGSFIHTGHRHGTGQGISWGNIDSIDE